MTTTINGVKVGYTNNGNPYKKSSTGKNIGTAVGLGALGLAVRKANKHYIATANEATLKVAPNTFALIKKFIKDGPTLGDKIHAILSDAAKGTNVNRKIMDILSKSKSARIGVIAGGVALCVGLYAGLGRLLGHCVDKVIEFGAKKEADRKA